jgi:hypothetical protein
MNMFRVGDQEGVGKEEIKAIKKKSRNVAHTCNLSYSGSGNWENQGSRPAQAKSSQHPISSNTKLSLVLCACYLSYMGNVNRRIEVRPNPA